MTTGGVSIHPTAIVDASANIADGCVIGPHCHVGAQATLMQGVRLISNAVITGATEIGVNTVVHPFAVLGGDPQHLGYKGEPTRLTIGADCVIREHVTMNIGTVAGGGETRVSNRCFIMAAAHVAHDCHVGADVIMANNATLGGHVSVGNNAFLGGLCAIHQNCRIGAYAFVGGCAAVSGDVIPFGSAFGNHARLGGLNVIGMKRRGLPRQTIHRLRAVYKLLFEAEGLFKDKLLEARSQFGDCDDAALILDFVENGTARSLMTPAR